MNRKDLQGILNERDKKFKEEDKAKANKDHKNVIIALVIYGLVVATIALGWGYYYSTTTGTSNYAEWTYCQGLCEGKGMIGHVVHLEAGTCECINDDNELRVFEVKK